MSESPSDFGLRRTANNILSNFLLFAANILISLWYTPFLLGKIGSEMFGFIPLANSITGFMSIITYSLNVASARNITVELEKGLVERANQIFNTIFIGTSLLIIGTFPIAAALVLMVPVIFSVPIGAERQTQWLFLGVLAAFFLSMLSINFKVATFAKNRFDLKNVVTFVQRLSQIGVIVLLFYIDQPVIAYVGLGTLIAATLGLAGDCVLWKKLLPVLHLKLASFRRKYLGMLFRTGAWTFLYQVGYLLFLNTDMLVANRVLDLSLAGMYGALLVIPKNLRVMSLAFGGVWGPSILSKYSKSDYQGMDSIVKLSMKVIGLVVALPVGWLCGVAGTFLVFWLGPDFYSMSGVLICLIIHLASNLIVGPFFNVLVSFNRLKIPGIVSFCLGVVNLALMILFARRLGALGIAISGALTMTIYYSLFTPVYTAQILDYKWWHYLLRLLPVYAAVIGVAAVSYAITIFVPTKSLIQLFLEGGVVSVAYVLFVYQFGLANAEKEKVKSLLDRLFGLVNQRDRT